MRNDRARGDGNGIGEIPSGGIRIFDCERYALRRTPRDGYDREGRRYRPHYRGFRKRSDGCRYGDSLVGKNAVGDSAEKHAEEGRDYRDPFCASKFVVLHDCRRNGYSLPPFSPCFMDASNSAFIFSRAFGATNAT